MLRVAASAQWMSSSTSTAGPGRAEAQQEVPDAGVQELAVLLCGQLEGWRQIREAPA